MVKYWCLLLIMILGCLLVSCSPWRDSYLASGVGVLTQAEVREKLGKPPIVDDPLLSDDTTWMYRYILSEGELDPWGIKSFGQQAGSVLSGPEAKMRQKVYCYVYVLTFDKESVLRHWKREECQVPATPNPFQQKLPGA